MRIIGRIERVTLKKRIIGIKTFSRIIYLYFQNGHINLFKRYLYAGTYIDLDYEEDKTYIKNGIAAYYVNYVHQVFRFNDFEKIQYYDLVTRSSELRTLKTNIRANLTKTINSDNSKFKSITQVGINIAGSSTRDTTITKLGLLFDVSTDQEKLAEYIKEQSDFVSILSENPDDVFYFFTDSETVYEKDEKGKETSKIVSVGWARVYSDYLDKTVNSTSALYKKTATNGTIESEISLLKNQIESQTTRVEMYLERLYSQFAAMEERISTLQQSASYLTNLSTNNASK